MTRVEPAQRVEVISLDLVTIINPRVRSKRSFDELVQSISTVGLKKPITVTPSTDTPGRFDLVCGQGRLEAFRSLGEQTIPALVVDAERDDCLIASFVENFARRQHRAIDLLYDIGGMKQRGDSETEIARKTGLSYDYVHGVARLLERGEQRLLRAVESEKVPITVAVQIAEAEDADVQSALQHAYETGELRGRSILTARRLVEQRRRLGKHLRTHDARNEREGSAESILRAYREDADKKRILIRKADAARSRLHFITSSLERLLADRAFVALLKAEAIDTIPRPLAERMQEECAA